MNMAFIVAVLSLWHDMALGCIYRKVISRIERLEEVIALSEPLVGRVKPGETE
jgi:hypothetical protein